MTTPPADTVTPGSGVGPDGGPGAPAPVIELASRMPPPARLRAGIGIGWLAVLLAGVFAASPLDTGYFDFGAWGPIALGVMVLLVVVAWSARQQLDRRALTAAGALTALLGLSALSMLWAQSKQSAWTDTNRLGLYVCVFAVALLCVRDRRTARIVVIVLGLAALVTAVWFPLRFMFGGGLGAFYTQRLDSPIGYINGTAGLLVMGIWPWIGLAETSARREVRAAALGAATLIAATFVLTQSRAVVPATILSALLVIGCAPGRGRRALKLLGVVFGVALSAPWTLNIYTSTLAATESVPVHAGAVRGAGIAILLAGVVIAGLAYAASGLAARTAPETLARGYRRFGTALAALVVLAIVVGGAAGHSWISRQYHEFTSNQVNLNATSRFTDASGYRYDLWRIAVKEFSQHPFGGVGAGNYDRDYYRWRRTTQYIQQPHSLELQMLAELGIFGLLALLAFIAVVIRGGFARAGTLASEDVLIRVAALGIFSAWLIDTSVDWLYDIPGLAGTAMIAAALLLVPARGRPGATGTGAPADPAGAQTGAAGATGTPARRRSRGAQLGFVASFVVLALLAASVGRQYVASRYAASGSHQIAKDPQKALRTLRTAVRLNPYALGTYYSIASAYAQLDDYQQARDALLVAKQREPSNYVPSALLGDLAMRRGDYRVAVRAYRRAASLDRMDSEVQTSLRAAEKAAR